MLRSHVYGSCSGAERLTGSTAPSVQPRWAAPFAIQSMHCKKGWLAGLLFYSFYSILSKSHFSHYFQCIIFATLSCFVYSSLIVLLLLLILLLLLLRLLILLRKWFEPRSDIIWFKWSSGWLESWDELLLVTDISATCGKPSSESSDLISNGNRTEWTTIQGVIRQVISNQWSATCSAALKLRAQLPLNCKTQNSI